MFQLPTTIYIKNKGKIEDSSIQYLFQKLQAKVIFISQCLNSITSSQNSSINTIHSTIENEIQSYTNTLNNFLITLPKFRFPSLTTEELHEELKQYMVSHQQELVYKKLNVPNPFQNLNKQTPQHFYPTTTPFQKYINTNYSK